jgi:hypothetical protein
MGPKAKQGKRKRFDIKGLHCTCLRIQKVNIVIKDGLAFFSKNPYSPIYFD